MTPISWVPEGRVATKRWVIFGELFKTDEQIYLLISFTSSKLQNSKWGYKHTKHVQKVLQALKTSVAPKNYRNKFPPDIVVAVLVICGGKNFVSYTALNYCRVAVVILIWFCVLRQKVSSSVRNCLLQSRDWRTRVARKARRCRPSLTALRSRRTRTSRATLWLEPLP